MKRVGLAILMSAVSGLYFLVHGVYFILFCFLDSVLVQACPHE